LTPLSSSRRAVAFVNVAHALDHYVLLIYPTAVIAMAADLGRDYGPMIALSTGAFVAFGLFALPMGWLAERVGRRNLLATFFFGCATSLAGLTASSTPTAIALWLFVLGVFTAIYHPIGASLLVSHASSLGRSLGWNGVFGNLGSAFASGGTALLASTLGWRAAFLAPAAVCLAVGLAYLVFAPAEAESHVAGPKTAPPSGVGMRVPVLLALFAAALIAGGMTFNITSISLPKAIDERLGLDVPLAVTGALATGVFLFGAMPQLIVGRLVDRVPLPTIFVGLAALQPLGLGLAATTGGAPMLAGLTLAIAAIYGQVVVNDAMVARYTPPHLRTKAYSVRYFLGFTASGFAAPLIAVAHAGGGFGLVFTLAAAFGTVIFGAAVCFFVASKPAAAQASSG